MFQKGFKKGALPVRNVSPLIPINCLVNSEQFVNNSSSNKINSCLPNKNNSCPQKTKAALMNPFMSIDGEERRRSEPKKSNNFERFFSDSTLTFLTFENTFRLPILPSRRIVFLCLPQILLCLPLIFLCLPLIFPGCASKSPILKGK